MSHPDNSTMSDLDITQSLERKMRLKTLLDKGILIENLIGKKSAESTLDAVCSLVSDSDQIMNEVSSADRVEHTTEVVMDVQVLKMSHELVSKVLLQSSNFNAEEYSNAINNIVYRSENPNWEAISNVACAIVRTARTQSSMLGAIEPSMPTVAVKEQQRRKRQQLAEERRPEAVEKMKAQDKGAQKVNIVHQQIAHLFKVNGRKPIPFFKLIIDPENFMNTVENAFQLAFLARDGIVGIQSGSDGWPEVRLATSEERKAGSDTTQAICSLNMKLCEDMRVFYNIKEALLKVPADTRKEPMDED